jgi:CRISPR-associated protein (TIGR02584 family)
MNPAKYPRRVLLAVSGLSPQIITETLYALAISSSAEERFVPTEIEVVTTAEGAQRIRHHLLNPESGMIGRFCRDFGLAGIRFTENHIHTVKAMDGSPLMDIRTADDNSRLADEITQRVRILTADPDCALHVSLAGGRKTMGFYAGYVLSLLGRLQDRLSHVLVSEPFESAPDFWYPRPQPEWLSLRSTSTPPQAASPPPRPLSVSSTEARIGLAMIPFVRLRQGLPLALLEGREGFGATVAGADMALGPAHLSIHLARRDVLADGKKIKLQPAPFAFYVALASRAIQSMEPLQAPLKDAHDPAWALDVLSALRHAYGEMRVPDKIEESLRTDCSGSKVSPMVSRLRRALASGLNPGRSHLYFDDGGTHRHKRYAVPLLAGSITLIRHSEDKK